MRSVLWHFGIVALCFTGAQCWGQMPEVSFAAHRDFLTGANTYTVVIGDFNNDGISDLAAANLVSKDVTVALGKAGGGYKILSPISLGNNPYTIVAADFNHDGITDLAVSTNDAASTTHYVSVLLGKGDGTFQPPVNYAVGVAPFVVIAVDVNADGKPDLITSNAFDNTLSVLIGNGDGTFQKPVSYPAGPDPYAVAAADFNRDGRIDLVTVNRSRGTVSILFGNGTGGFGSPLTSNIVSPAHVSVDPIYVAVGDFNGDGKPDLAVTNFNGDRVMVLAGNGDGTFTTTFEYWTGASSTPYRLAVGDLDGDSHQDLVVGLPGTARLAVLHGNGDATFATPAYYGAGKPSGIAVGDLDGDGHADVAVSNSTDLGTVSIYHGNGDGTLLDAGIFAIPRYPLSMVLGNFNGDNAPDIATTDGSFVDVVLGNGSGGFLAPVPYKAGNGPSSILVDDFDGNHVADLAVMNSNETLSILLGRGDGTFASATTFGAGTSGGGRPASGDFNHDGKRDLVIPSFRNNSVVILLGDGKGSFTSAGSWGVCTSPDSVVVADFNKDGFDDLAVSCSGGKVAILLNNGNGTFAAASSYPAGTTPFGIKAADFNRDGNIDLVVANVGTSNNGNTVSVLLGRGDGTFGAPTAFMVGQNPRAIAVGDLNGDGFGDLVVTSPYNNDVAVLMGTGQGGFYPPQFYGTWDQPQDVVIADITADGRPDILVANYGIGGGTLPIASNIGVLVQLCQQNCPASCQTQIDALKTQITNLQNRLPVFQGWRPPTASPSDASMSFNLPLVPDLAVVTLFQWDWHRADRPLFTLNPMPSVMVPQNSTAVINVPKQTTAPRFSADQPCQVYVTLTKKTLSYTTSACPGDQSSPAFNIMFVFTNAGSP